MKNIHILPAKESVLGFRNGNFILRLDEPFTEDGNANPQHLYITSDEEIKVDDWCFEVHNGESNAPIDTPKFKDDEGNTWWLRRANANDEAECKTTKKIVMTTDINLVIDGVQSISFKFLQWFEINPCDTIEILKETFYKNKKGLQPFPDETCKGRIISYSLIRPKDTLRTSAEWQQLHTEMMVIDADGWDRENYQYSWFEELITLDEYKHRRMRSTCYGLTPEPKEKTLEEVTKEFANNGTWQCPISFEAGAKWQQERHDSLYKSIRTIRNELRDKYEVAGFHEAGRLKEQVKGIDMILTKFEQFKL